MTKRILELNLGALILLTFAVGCGGNSSDSGAGGASSSASAGNPGTPNAGAANGGAATSSGGASGGAAHASGGQSNPGTGGASNSGGFSTSVPGSTPLKDLTPDQLMQLCSDAQKYTETVLGPVASDLLCKVQALAAASQETTDAAAQTACKDGLAACMPDLTTDPGMCDATTAETCTATVADLTLCANDSQARLTMYAATIPSCDAITPEKAQAALAAFAGQNGMQPASCTKYDAECPGSMSGM